MTAHDPSFKEWLFNFIDTDTNLGVDGNVHSYNNYMWSWLVERACIVYGTGLLYAKEGGKENTYDELLYNPRKIRKMSTIQPKHCSKCQISQQNICLSKP